MSGSVLRFYRWPVMAGSACDPVGKEGLLSLTATMLAEGSTQKRSYKQILDAFFRMATRFRVQVDKELTVFLGRVHQDHAAEYEALIREMLTEPAFLPEDFERVKQDQLNALTVELRGNNDEELGKEWLYHELYAGHPYRHTMDGTEEGLKAITLEDVKACFAQYFGAVPQAVKPVLALPEPGTVEGLHCSLLDKPEARSVAMSFGHPIPVRRGHPDYPALLVAQSWLGQHRNGGRLFDQIREVRGLNYGDYAYLEYFPRGMYQFEPDPNVARQQQIFQVWLRPVVREKALFAFRLALHEIEQLQKNGLSEEEFERTRGFLLKYSKLLLKTPSIVAGYGIDSEFYGTPEYIEYLGQGLGALRCEDVQAAAAKYLSVENLYFVAVGPGMEEFAAAMKASAESPISYEVDVPQEVLDEDKVVAARPLRVASAKVQPVTEAFVR